MIVDAAAAIGRRVAMGREDTRVGRLGHWANPRVLDPTAGRRPMLSQLRQSDDYLTERASNNRQTHPEFPGSACFRLVDRCHHIWNSQIELPAHIDVSSSGPSDHKAKCRTR